MSISPFSLEHDWSIHWTRIPSHFKAHERVNNQSTKEQKALYALACVGLISQNQLMQLFNLKAYKVKQMVKEQKIVKHMLNMNTKTIPIYSLGINGAKVINLNGYEHNYWVEYKISDILKRILYFKFYERFSPVQLFPSTDPFIGSFQYGKNIFYVYVARGNTNDLLMYCKWNYVNERIIIITEALEHLKEIQPYLSKLNCRIILDEAVINADFPLDESFYFINQEGQYMKEKRTG